MTEEEIRAVPMSWELWNEMTVDERFLYNRAAFDADIQGKPVERWHAGWLGAPFTFGSDLHFPFRPWEESSRTKWYLIKYPDGTVLGFNTAEKAQHAAVGQDVALIVAQEVGE